MPVSYTHFIKKHSVSADCKKPDKIYLENTNITNAINPSMVNKGNTGETFFVNQLLNNNTISIPNEADFLVNNKYLFEIGGKNKTRKQIQNADHAYIVADDIEYGSGNKIPLWLFGFLY